MPGSKQLYLNLWSNFQRVISCCFACLLSQSCILLHTARHGQFLLRDEAIPSQSQYAFQRPNLLVLTQAFNCDDPDKCFLMAPTLQLSLCSWLHFRNAERVTEATLQCFSEVVLGWVWIIYLISLYWDAPELVTALIMYWLAVERPAKRICSVSGQKTAQIWKELQILEKAVYK